MGGVWHIRNLSRPIAWEAGCSTAPRGTRQYLTGDGPY